MNRHLSHGIIVGILFAVPIAWIAATDAIAEGNALAILSTLVFGLAAGLCIGALIAANFAMYALEEKESEHAPARRQVEAHVHAG